MPVNCKNCGAPMKLVRDRDFFVCEHCTTFHFPAESQDGVRVLGEPSDLRCPVCDVPLVEAAIEECRAHHCERCNGVLVAQLSFGLIVQLRRARRAGPTEPQRPLDPAEARRRLACPRCRESMDTHPYYGGGSVMIDTCGACRFVWLDRGEIARIVRA